MTEIFKAALFYSTVILSLYAVVTAALASSM